MSSIPIIVSTKQALTLVGAGQCSLASVTECLRLAPVVVAADGGAAAALAAGAVPQAVIGDLDSIDTASRDAIPAQHLHHVGEQDSTDFDKCLLRISAPLILAPGFLGGRVDHALAAFSTVVRSPQRCILVGDHDLAFHLRPGETLLDLPADARVSLFPMGPVRGRSTGLEWPIDGLEFAPAGRIGTSNRALGPVRLTMDGPGMVVLLAPQYLSAAIAALSSGGSE